MRRLFTLLARYNAHANSQMFELLRKAPPELISRSSGSYYGSIMGLLNHTLISDLGWLNAYRHSDLRFPSLDTPVLDFERPADGAPLYDDLEELWRRREQVDAVLSAFAGELTDELLAGTITMDRRGQKHTFVLAEVLLHLFNHQTHHRGAVSQILDREGIENDFSNIVRLLTPR
jgi:uncharacterized damage-inducible protein DinB